MEQRSNQNSLQGRELVVPIPNEIGIPWEKQFLNV